MKRRAIVGAQFVPRGHGMALAQPIAPYAARTGRDRALVVRETPPPGAPKPRLLDRVHAAVRTRHYSRRTEKAYVAWPQVSTARACRTTFLPALPKSTGPCYPACRAWSAALRAFQLRGMGETTERLGERGRRRTSAWSRQPSDAAHTTPWATRMTLPCPFGVGMAMTLSLSDSAGNRGLWHLGES